MNTIDFAAAARSAAERCTPAMEFMGRKFWLCDLARQLGLARPDFDRLVLEANHQGLLKFSRCDLVEAFPASKVRESLVQQRIDGRVYSEFHFLRLP